MVYWTVQWVRQKNSKYLVAALVTQAAGMFVFLEVAPALFILPVVWWMYRPPLRFRPILLAGILSIAIWYPYLRLEYGRNFSDLRATIGRRNNLAADYKKSWCNPDLTLVNLESGPPALDAESDPVAVLPASLTSRLIKRVLPLWERSHLAVMG